MVPWFDVSPGAKTPALRNERPKNLVSDLCWLLSRANQRQEREFEAEAMAASGLTARKHHVLMAALEAERTQNQLARVIGLDTTTMVVTLDELVSDGLAERRIHPKDRRARVVVVTPAGKRAVLKCDAALVAAQDRILSRLSDEERAVFLSALEQLAFPDEEATDEPAGSGGSAGAGSSAPAT